MSLQLIDTHAHLYMLEHKPIPEVLDDAAELGVTRCICIGAARGLESAATALELARQFPNVWATAGIHPHDAGTCTDVRLLEPYFADPRVVAVGETGLDFFRDWAPFELQRKVFSDTIALAKNFKKPLVIHCRDAHDEALKTLKAAGADSVGGVFHCYAEDAEFAKKLRDLNFLVSLTGILTFKNAVKLRSEVAKIPLEQIMLETDCPYMAPEPHRGKQAEPMHVHAIADCLALVHQRPLAEVAAITTATAERFFGLPVDSR